LQHEQPFEYRKKKLKKKIHQEKRKKGQKSRCTLNAGIYPQRVKKKKASHRSTE